MGALILAPPQERTERIFAPHGHSDLGRSAGQAGSEFARDGYPATWDFPAGALISAIGASSTLFLSSAMVGVYAVAVALVRPSIRSA